MSSEAYEALLDANTYSMTTYCIMNGDRYYRSGGRLTIYSTLAKTFVSYAAAEAWANKNVTDTGWTIEKYS